MMPMVGHVAMLLLQLPGLQAGPGILDVLHETRAISLLDVSKPYWPEGDSVSTGHERAPATGTDRTTSQGFLVDLYRELRAGIPLDQLMGTPASTKGGLKRRYGEDINTFRTVPVKVSLLTTDWHSSTLRLVLTCNMSSLAADAGVVRRLELRLPGVSGQFSVSRVRVGGYRVPVRSGDVHSSRGSRVVDLTDAVSVFSKRFGQSTIEIKLVLKLRSAKTKWYPPWIRKTRTRLSRQSYMYQRHSLVDSTNDFSGIFLVAYSFSSNVLSGLTLPTNSSKPSLHVHRSRRTKQTGSRRHSKRHTVYRPDGRLCHRQDFIVDFKQLGWDTWVVFPEKFNAYYCGGRCPSPVGESYDPTNHAQVQSLMRSNGESVVPRPCCVPTVLRPLSMIYYENDELVVRHHEDMIVERCGCR